MAIFWQFVAIALIAGNNVCMCVYLRLDMTIPPDVGLFSYIRGRFVYCPFLLVLFILALTFSDIDREKKTLSVTKSYQRLKGRDVITAPKTPKSNRVIHLPAFLVSAIDAYASTLNSIRPEDRLIPVSKSFLEKEMIRGVTCSGVPKIRIHDLRHSHVSLLIELGFSAKEIAERVGHENVETTLNTYSHLYPNKQAHIADQLEDAYHTLQHIPVPQPGGPFLSAK